MRISDWSTDVCSSDLRHFRHDVPSVNLQRDLAGSEFSRRLFVEKSADYQGQHPAFAWREVEIPSPQHPQFSARRSHFPVLRNRASTAIIRSASLKGFVRKSTAPPLIARTEDGMSPWQIGRAHV